MDRYPQVADSVSRPAIRPRILLADDNPEFLAEAVNLLEDTFDVVGAYPDGKSVLKEAMAADPDVIVLDLSMGDITGIEVIRRLRAMGSNAKLLILSVHENADFVRAAFAAGASGYVFKSALGRDLVAAIEAVCSGDLFISSGR